MNRFKGLISILGLWALPVCGQEPAVFCAGDLWESFLPTHVGKHYREDVGDPQTLSNLLCMGNHDRQWTTPTQMYPGGENLHMPWRQVIEMVEYSPGANPYATDPEGTDHLYAFETPQVQGERSADSGAHWVDEQRRQQLMYEARTPTNMGVDVRFRIRQWTLNHYSVNDFIAVELELTNTGVLDADGDGVPEATDNRINCLTLGWRHEPINSMTNDSLGRRGESGWFTGPVSGYDATPDADGLPWDVPLTFSGPNADELTAVGPSGIPWAPNGRRMLGNTMAKRAAYYDIYTGAQWIAAKRGRLPDVGSSVLQDDKRTIYGSHPVGVERRRGWFTSVTRNFDSNGRRAWESHSLAMSAFLVGGQGGQTGSAWRPGNEVLPDPNWFDPTHPEIAAGNPLSFVEAVRPEEERGQPLGDGKYRNQFTQNWEQGNSGVLADGSDTDWTSGYSTPHMFDGDIHVGIGPFSLEVGESMSVVFIDYAGFRLQGVRRARRAAQWAYEQGWAVPESPPTPDMRVVSTAAGQPLVRWDRRAEAASDFAGYKIYRSAAGEPIDSRKLGTRLLDHYHEQAVEEPAADELAALGVPNNPNISSDEYRAQASGAWGPYYLIRRIPAEELLQYRLDSGEFAYGFVDEEALPPDPSLYYYVAAYDDESGSISGMPFSSLESHRANWNGRSGLWEGTYWFAHGSDRYPSVDDVEGLQRIGAPFTPAAALAQTAVAEASRTSAAGLALAPAHPNPFNSTVSISYSVPSEGLVELRVYSAVGQPVAALVDQRQAAGTYEVSWDGRDDERRQLATGLYFCRLRSGRESATRKLMLLR